MSQQHYLVRFAAYFSIFSKFKNNLLDYFFTNNKQYTNLFITIKFVILNCILRSTIAYCHRLFCITIDAYCLLLVISYFTYRCTTLMHYYLLLVINYFIPKNLTSYQSLQFRSLLFSVWPWTDLIWCIGLHFESDYQCLLFSVWYCGTDSYYLIIYGYVSCKSLNNQYLSNTRTKVYVFYNHNFK